MFHLVASSSSTASGSFFFRDPRNETHTFISISIIISISRGRKKRLQPPSLPTHHGLHGGSRGTARAGNGNYNTASTAADTYCLTARDIRCVVMDIEGTTTPISFVANTLFPYSRAHARAHLAATYRTQQTMDDVALLNSQIDQDLAERVPRAVPVPEPEDDDKAAIDALVANVEAMIDADRKLPALKQLQDRIWRHGFESGEIKGVVYDDIAEALAEWNARGVSCCIYSSGSKEAQQLIFGNTQDHGETR